MAKTFYTSGQVVQIFFDLFFNAKPPGREAAKVFFMTF
jgi:hypothetical protein